MDFEDFTSTSQFDMNKVVHFARLDRIPGFCLLRSEKAYLEKYRALLRAEYEGTDPGVQDFKQEEQDSVPEPATQAVEKKTKKRTAKTEE